MKKTRFTDSQITSFYMTGGRPVLIDMLSPCGSGRACGRHGRY